MLSRSSGPWDGWDGCNVWISTDGGENFTVIEPEFPQYNCQHLWSFGHPDEGWNLGTDIAGWAGKSRGWKDVEFDLSEYNSEAVILRWAFASDLAYCAEDDPSLYGFFIDDIVISDGNIILFENHGEDEGEMLFDGNGSEAIDWLSINNGVGTISAGGQIMVDLSINAQNLAPGNYKGSVFLTVSDTLQNTIIIPIDLAIVPPEDLSLKLYNNYPNPFNNDTKISYYLPEMTWVKLRIYDIRGRETCTLVNKIQYPGLKQITWNGKNNAGKTVSSGMYIYTLQAGQKVLSQKMLLIR